MILSSKLKMLFVHDKRSLKALLNIVGSFLIKGLSILCSFILVPLTLDILTPCDYGIWLTLSSILVWIDYFDVGLGNGLRNKLSEALSLNKIILARVYVSTVFFALLMVAIFLFMIFVVLNQCIDWSGLLNAPKDMDAQITQMMLFVFLFVLMSFVLKIVTYVYFSKQLPIVNNLIIFLSQSFSLLVIYVLASVGEVGKIEWIAYAYSASPALILLMFYPITFCIYKELLPSIRYVKFKYMSSLMTLGIKFFLIQISCLMIYTTSNLIISRNLSPEEVIPYNIAFRYFNILFMFFVIVVSPMWNAVNDAYNRNEFDWIKKTMIFLNKIWLLGVAVAAIMLLLSDYFYKVWVGASITVPIDLSITLALYISILTYSSLYSNFLNGMNKLNMQLYVIILMGILFIPLANYLVNIMGVLGVALSLCIVNLPGAIINRIQYKKVITCRAKGLWTV